jgi:hypothetical protein
VECRSPEVTGAPTLGNLTGGLQHSGQQLGSSLGVALIGAIVLTGLTSGFVTTIQ